MKIKTDFITNSSSTSFILAYDTDFTIDEFMELIGIETGSSLEPIFGRLYHLILREMKPMDDIDIELKQQKSHPNVVEKLNNAINSGKKIYEGRFSSEDGDLIETIFCTESFEIENNHIYFNYLECSW